MTSPYSYFELAENDYKYHYQNILEGKVSNAIASGTQNTCERYLKHIIEKTWQPSSEGEVKEKESVLHTHNLKRLISYTEEKSDIQFSTEEKRILRGIDGFYYSTRYPGEDCMMATKDDMEECKNALDICRYKTINFCQEHQKEILTLDHTIEAVKLEKKFHRKSEVVVEKEKKKEQNNNIYER